ncbi:serine hydrolase [Paroceanicella profunda]|uniref:Serine hydrolase n=1 Tax=Paroceanicella profunda TaxID=2579971 RepID=A0A5B8FHF1_9RHOB|nr:serine hydrolase [Paroceanicella profunda]QDL92341.1 serine hydrolase [Paroceanicella profunda]
MPNRRLFLASTAAALCAPALPRAARAGGADVVSDARALPQLHAILVRRGAEPLVAEAPRGPGLHRTANIKSCSKSLVALLLGAAIARGELSGLDATLAEVAPALIPPDATEGVAETTMGDLVTLRAGLESTSGPNYGTWVASRNWVAHALTRPRVAPNGGRMIYSTGSTHVLGAALATVSGQSLLALARARLGAPLGIDIPSWTRDPQGFYFGGNDMGLTPEAMLRVALMMRDGGARDGTQVLPRDWISASRSPRTRSPWSGMAYGLGWFLTDSGWTLARGYGGQIIAAHPEAGLAAAITSDPTLPARSGGYFGDLMALLDGPVLALGRA